jgi:flagellar biosynthesis/type III secretory pathway chaperone
VLSDSRTQDDGSRAVPLGSLAEENMQELGAAVQHLREINTQNTMLLGSCLLMVQSELNMLSKLSDGSLRYTPAGRVEGRPETHRAGVDYRA